MEAFVERNGTKVKKPLNLPKKFGGQKYVVKDLMKDQQEIFAVILDKAKEWLECDDPKSFKPLRMIIQGAGGSGKSVLINTIVTVLREIFDDNDVVRVLAPTGVAAFNVGGETIHYCLGIGRQKSDYVPGSLNKDKKELLIKKFQRLLAIIIDERSMVNSKLFGTACQLVGETIHGGHCCNNPWGNLPILILVGDDYQLPSIERGCWDIGRRDLSYSPMAIKGDQQFEACGEHVRQLSSIKRMKEDQQKERLLCERLRLGEPTDEDVVKLLSLDLENLQLKFPGEEGKNMIDKIRQEAIYLFTTNNEIDEHNICRLAEVQSATNPVAFIKSSTSGRIGKMAVRSHFGKDSIRSTIICRGSKVALTMRNFQPSWGLHNGAVGIVEDIIFEKGKSPNADDLPRYVVVNFPAYIGPVWDKNNPKVNMKHKLMLRLRFCYHNLTTNYISERPHTMCSFSL